MFESLLNDISAINSAKKLVRKQVQELIRNKALDLEDRWDLFVKAKDILEIESYSDLCLRELYRDLSPYDVFNMERHQTQMYDDLWETIESWLVEYDDGFAETDYTTEYKLRYKVGKWDANAWREAVLLTGYAGGVYDW